MVQSYANVIEFIKQLMLIDKRLFISDVDIIKIEKFITVYKIIATFTCVMQNSSILFSHFYAQWLLLEDKISFIKNNTFADILLLNLTERRKIAFENCLYNMGLFFGF